MRPAATVKRTQTKVQKLKCQQFFDSILKSHQVGYEWRHHNGELAVSVELK